jgi:hypothetical protein
VKSPPPRALFTLAKNPIKSAWAEVNCSAFHSPLQSRFKWRTRDWLCAALHIKAARIARKGFSVRHRDTQGIAENNFLIASFFPLFWLTSKESWNEKFLPLWNEWRASSNDNIFRNPQAVWKSSRSTRSAYLHLLFASFAGNCVNCNKHSRATFLNCLDDEFITEIFCWHINKHFLTFRRVCKHMTQIYYLSIEW